MAVCDNKIGSHFSRDSANLCSQFIPGELIKLFHILYHNEGA